MTTDWLQHRLPDRCLRIYNLAQNYVSNVFILQNIFVHNTVNLGTEMLFCTVKGKECDFHTYSRNQKAPNGAKEFAINARVLGTMQRGEKFSIGLELNPFQFTCYKKCIVVKTKAVSGELNGDISQFLALVQVLKQALIGVLFNYNFNLKVLETFSDPKGRFIITGIQTNERKLTLANTYAPSDDNLSFF